MDPANILSRFRDKYSQCEYYSDVGSARVAAYSRFCEKHVENFENVEKVEFETQYSFPASVNFSFRRINPRFGKSDRILSIKSDGSTVIEDLDIYEVATAPSQNLAFAVAGATGLSAGAASLVLPLLMPELRASNSATLIDLKNVSLIGEYPNDGSDCYVLRGKMNDSDKYVLWISTKDYSLRCVRCNTYATGSRHIFSGKYTFNSSFDKPIS